MLDNQEKQSIESFLTHSAEETASFAASLGKTLSPNSILCFFGELAAGKTTFIKGLAQGAAHLDPAEVQSPTFAYLNIYEGSKTIFHFDLYRLKGVDDFISMGFDEYLDAGGICCIEWSERISTLLPSHAIHIYLLHLGENKRMITIKKINHDD